ncbi:MAG: hypothetical protein WAZ69_11580 [Trichococcus flocculiformis]|jgi:uncharacterized protein YukE
MYINQKWDYPTMAVCATKLDELRDASNANKVAMDKAFETLATGVQAEVGKAFVGAYSEHVSTIQLFTQVLSAEAELLRNNSNTMQNADEEIAAQVRSMFSV